MDSKKRHELETNDLREFLDNFKDFWEKHGNAILIALIVLVGGFTAITWYKKGKAEKFDNAANALVSANTGELLLRAAEDHPTIRHVALLYAGDAFLAESQTALAAGLDAESQAGLGNAANAYQEVVEDEDHPIELRINAYIGLGTVAEQQGEWDKAKAAYNQAVTLAGDRFVVVARGAQAALDRLESLKEPVPFGPEAVEETPEDTDGGTSATPDENNGDITDFVTRPEFQPGAEDPETDSTDNSLFPDDDSDAPGIGEQPLDLPLDNPLGGDGSGGEEEPIEIDPLLEPGGGE